MKNAIWGYGRFLSVEGNKLTEQQIIVAPHFFSKTPEKQISSITVQKKENLKVTETKHKNRPTLGAIFGCFACFLFPVLFWTYITYGDKIKYGDLLNTCEGATGDPNGLLPKISGIPKLLILENGQVQEWQNQLPSEYQVQPGNVADYVICLKSYQQAAGSCAYEGDIDLKNSIKVVEASLVDPKTKTVIYKKTLNNNTQCAGSIWVENNNPPSGEISIPTYDLSFITFLKAANIFPNLEYGSWYGTGALENQFVFNISLNVDESEPDKISVYIFPKLCTEEITLNGISILQDQIQFQIKDPCNANNSFAFTGTFTSPTAITGQITNLATSGTWYARLGGMDDWFPNKQ